MEFNKISLDDYGKYSEYYKKCMVACAETSFMAVWLNSFAYETLQAFEKDFYWHKMNWLGEDLWLPPVGDWDSVDWEEILTEVVPEETVFGFVPEYLLKKWQKFSDRIEVEEMRAEWDYIYSINKQVECKGKAYSSWRGAINHFEKNHAYTFADIKQDDIEEIKVFQEKWMADNASTVKMTEELVHENETLYPLLKNWGKLPCVIGKLLRVEGKIVAYIIVEQLDENIISGLFLKADKEYPKAAKFIKHQLYKCLSDDYFAINAWGDSDLEGLRRNKLEENPITLYKKYKVTWKK